MYFDNYGRKRIILLLFMATNLLLLYLYYNEPDYFFTGIENPKHSVPENIIITNSFISKIAKIVFPVSSIFFIIYGTHILRTNQHISLLFFSSLFIVNCFLNSVYRFF